MGLWGRILSKRGAQKKKEERGAQRGARRRDGKIDGGLWIVPYHPHHRKSEASGGGDQCFQPSPESSMTDLLDSATSAAD